MNGADILIARLDAIFNPASIAVVGVPKEMKTGKLFLMALIDQGFPGIISPVHPTADEIDGLKAYPSLSSIPGPVEETIQAFFTAGLPFFESAERAMKTCAMVRDYQRWRAKRHRSGTALT